MFYLFPPRQAFSFFDQDGDGTITADELCMCMKKLGEELSKEEIEEMVKEADADGNGEIEFSGMYIKWTKKHLD